MSPVGMGGQLCSRAPSLPPKVPRGSVVLMPNRISRLASICPTCGTPFTRDDPGAYCDDCRPKKDDRGKTLRRGNRHQQGYDNTWQRLSKRARERQPWCSDCGATDDLTTDHSEEAWKRRAAGKVIRLQDVDVVCRRCNSERGAARGEKASDQWRAPTVKR